jgi:hypothetical protein
MDINIEKNRLKPSSLYIPSIDLCLGMKHKVNNLRWIDLSTNANKTLTHVITLLTFAFAYIDQKYATFF